MFTWKKLGKVFTPQNIEGIDWLKEFSQAPSAIVFNDFVRIYFSCRPQADLQGYYVSNTAYVDLERKNLFKIINFASKPILPLGDLGTFDEFGIYPVSVIRKENNYIAFYGGWTRCESVPFNVAIGCAISKDMGKTFTKLGSGPIISYSPQEPFIISGPKIRYFNGRWYLWYIAGKKWILDKNKPEPVYKIRMAWSDDCMTWFKQSQDIIESVLEVDEAQASPDVFYSNGKYHMFFCYRYSKQYRCKENGYRIGYAYSFDLLNWQRDDSKVGIDVSDEGWDSEMISYPHVFEVDSKIYMAYLGNQVGKFGFGLALLEGELV